MYRFICWYININGKWSTLTNSNSYGQIKRIICDLTHYVGNIYKVTQKRTQNLRRNVKKLAFIPTRTQK